MLHGVAQGGKIGIIDKPCWNCGSDNVMECDALRTCLMCGRRESWGNPEMLMTPAEAAASLVLAVRSELQSGIPIRLIAQHFGIPAQAVHQYARNLAEAMFAG